MSIQDIVKRAVLALGFEERTGLTVFDSSPKHNNGTLAGAPSTPTWVAGEDGFGGALDFDGDDDYVDLGNKADWNLAAIGATFIARIKAPTLPTDDYARLLTRFIGGDPGAGFYFHMRSATGYINFQWRADGENLNLIPQINYTDNEDHLVIVSVDVTTKTGIMYMDGISIATGTYTGNLLDRNSNLYIGGFTDSSNWKGIISEIIILPYTLTPTEVRALEESRSAFTATPNLRRGLVLDLDFQEGAGTKAFDKSWYANNGDLGPGAGHINNETFTSFYDTPVQLIYTNLTPGTTVVTDNGTTFTEGPGDDYTMDNEAGTITVLSTGAMANDTEYYIDYDYADSYPTWVEGGGLDFNSLNDYVNIDASASLLLADNGTIIARVLSTELDGSDIIYSARGGAGTDRAPYFRVFDGVLRAYMSNGVDTENISSNLSLTLNKQHTVAFMWNDDDKVKIYRDLDVYETNKTIAVQFTAAGFWIGNWPPASWAPWKGIIDKLRVYNRMLTPTEYRAIHEEWN